jgi:LysM repeat protein
MSADRRTHRARTPRAVPAGVPAALAGSIALVLTAGPATAAESHSNEPLRRSSPAVGERTPGLTLAVRVATAPAPEMYTVQRGDTVSAIAARFGLRIADVFALNGLGWRSVIYPGQVLRLAGTTAPAPAPVAPVAATPVAASATHTVRQGDTVSGIAKRHGVSTQSLLAANGLGWSSIIRPGQVLAITGTAAAAPAPATPPPAPAPSAPVPSAPVAGGSYTVKGGDTISSIASRHGVSVNAVLSANKLGWSSIIYPGQTIAIPRAVVSIPGLTSEQVANAVIIVQVGRQLGVSDRGITIALGTAMTESGIRNLDWGDRDSLGLFQQRPSYGWGTAEQVRDPVRAAKVFYGGPSDPNGWNTRGLLDYPGWESMTFTQAAQAVQNSAYPDAYARWEQPAATWLAALR